MAAAAFTLLTGILTVQAIGLRGGASFAITNELVGVQEPAVPYFYMFLIALLVASTVGFLVLGFRKQLAVARLSFRLGFFVFTSLELVFTFARIQRGDPFLNIVDPTVSALEGWLLKACNESSFHLVVLISLCMVFASAREMKRAPVLE